MLFEVAVHGNCPVQSADGRTELDPETTIVKVESEGFPIWLETAMEGVVEPAWIVPMLETAVIGTMLALDVIINISELTVAVLVADIDGNIEDNIDGNVITDAPVSVIAKSLLEDEVVLTSMAFCQRLSKLKALSFWHQAEFCTI